MRILSIIIISFSILLSTGCSSGSQINGRSFKTALKSVKMIRGRLPQEKRIAFELSFWAIRTSYRNNTEFLDIVDGKTPDELIEVGKEVFAQRKAEGFEEYQQYANWDDMIAKYKKDREQQSMKKKRDPRDAENSVLYKL
ncbi:MAG: hypothetical protein HON51_05570 [Gammaproteobacteria bacterium]|jgi:hypothetical protein|nr:hypothetical protein [Gammaproteobacteria bacterium]MBT5221592.1 hypothetical protein [Gammaproteobacteria bacterium]MBT5824801.1 hypothetical protein [Gammaproteobacteria bacterium]MBT5966724.1 hypothetical protein [Gammaproteobacteria bacterium]MBT6420827.1 hypothetical protein [Gammaproteobacteria bacterium]